MTSPMIPCLDRPEIPWAPVAGGLCRPSESQSSPAQRPAPDAESSSTSCLNGPGPASYECSDMRFRSQWGCTYTRILRGEMVAKGGLGIPHLSSDDPKRATKTHCPGRTLGHAFDRQGLNRKFDSGPCCPAGNFPDARCHLPPLSALESQTSIEVAPLMASTALSMHFVASCRASSGPGVGFHPEQPAATLPWGSG